MSTTTPSPGKIRCEIQGNTASIYFDHPQAYNAMTKGMYEGLRDICLDIAKKPEIRVAILRGVGGKSFVSGSDIAQFTSFVDGQDGVEYEVFIDSCFKPLQMLNIPTIAVIEGLAVGGGLVVASSCDFRIATPEARFGVPIAKTLGNCVSPMNMAWLVAHLGYNVMRRMLLLAEFIPASELLASGYIYKTVAASELDQLSNDLARKLSALAPLTQKSAKHVLARLINHGLPNGDDLTSECYGSLDFKEGVQAFLAGKAPKWQGK